QGRSIMSGVKRVALGFAVLLLAAPAGRADLFNGTLFYTNFNGGVNVNRVDYSYNSVSNVFTTSNQQGIASLLGADGISFAADCDLLVGGQVNEVFKLHTNGTGITFVNAVNSAYHLALNPNGLTAYTSTFSGPLVTIPMNPFSNGTAH